MLNRITFAALLLLAGGFASAQDEAGDDAANETVVAEAEAQAAEAAPDEEAAAEQDPGGPKEMSGMSILGNEEAPKSLVIVPWKSSELGDDLSLTDTLDERARPVDKEVFLRELAFYRIRSSD